MNAGEETLPAPLRPRSPPGCTDLYGRRRYLARIHLLDREITFLQEELKSIELAQPSSRCCQELTKFVESSPDPLVADDRNPRESECCSWKCIWRASCLKPEISGHRSAAATRPAGRWQWSEAVCCGCGVGNCCHCCCFKPSAPKCNCSLKLCSPCSVCTSGCCCC